MLSTQLLDCRNLSPGSTIDVETKSRHYRIEYLGGNSVRVSGHPEFCPNPVMASLQGSLGSRRHAQKSALHRVRYAA